MTFLLFVVDGVFAYSSFYINSASINYMTKRSSYSFELEIDVSIDVGCRCDADARLYVVSVIQGKESSS